MTKILALDSATEQCSAALLVDGQLFERKSTAVKQHAAEILGMVDEVLKESGCRMPDIDFIAYGQGPGSFTGVRIAVSAAQGIALALNKKLVGVSSLEAMALRAIEESGKDTAVAAIDARMGEVYLGIYQRKDGAMNPLCAEQVLKPEKALEQIAAATADLNFAACGTGIKVLQKNGFICDQEPQNFPEPSAIIKIAQERFAAQGGVDAEQAQPVYIRNEVTWKKLSEQGKQQH